MKIKISIFIIILLIAITFFALTLHGVAGNPLINRIKNNLDQATKPFELSPERGRYLLTYSLAENKTFALTKEAADAAYPDVGYYKGRFYIFFTPGVSLLALPFYQIGKLFNLAQVFSFATITFFALLNCLFIYLVAKRIFKLSFWLSLFAALVFAFASTSWSYAITLYQHQVATFLILSSFFAVWKFRQRGKLSFLWGFYVWFCFGAAIWVDYPNAILMIPVMIYFFLTAFKYEKTFSNLHLSYRLSFFLTSVFFLTLVILHGYYNYINFGGWNKVSGGLVGYKTIKEQKISESQKDETKLLQLENKKSPVGFFKEEHLPFSFYTLLFSDDRGLFLYSPIFVLAIFGLLQLFKKRINLEGITLVGTVLINLFLYSSWDDPWGGWAFGPRYLIPSMSILAIMVAYWLHCTKYKFISRLIAFLLFIPSAAIALLGALTTNAVPPKVEGVYLKIKYNFLFNLDFLRDGRSGSFAFNEFFAKYMNLTEYYILILFALVIFSAFILFILPKYEKA